MNTISEIIAAAVTEVLPVDGDIQDAAQTAALRARGAAALVGLDERAQESAAQGAFTAICGPQDEW
jgi:hypothetical protein